MLSRRTLHAQSDVGTKLSMSIGEEKGRQRGKCQQRQHSAERSLHADVIIISHNFNREVARGVVQNVRRAEIAAAAMYVSSALAITGPRNSGQTAAKKVLSWPAPKLRAASSRDKSAPSSAAET